MLRFGTPTPKNRFPLTSAAGLRIWLLLGLLGIVIAGMQILKQTTTVAQLDSVLKTPQSNVENSKSSDPIVQETQENDQQSANSEFSYDLSQVKDNTYFRPEESTAWFTILDSLSNRTSQQIRKASMGEVTYAQLMDQPNVYRGRVVTIRGKVLREEILNAPENDVGIASYHRLVIRPRGGGVWPMIVYCLELPDSFSRAEDLNVEVGVNGVFFKNWSYAWEEGLGLAPVILAKSIDLQSSLIVENVPPESPTERPEQPPSNTVQAGQGGFREVLELAGLGPALLETFSGASTLKNSDWQILAQLFARLQQYGSADLVRWTLPVADSDEKTVGELYKLSGTVVEQQAITVPAEVVRILGSSEVYRCQLQRDDSQMVTLFTQAIPARWLDKTPLSEPAVCRAVLLAKEGSKTFMATPHLEWFPASGVPDGQLLLAKFGMDASLWDTIGRRGESDSPQTNLETEAFYECLAALADIPVAMFTQLVSAHLAEVADQKPRVHNITEKQIALKIADQAEQGFSSVIPLFLDPNDQIGELVRLEGVARRAVRIVEDSDSVSNKTFGRSRDYYELELFTPDSQNLPIVCCVTQLPEGFPQGDEIREQVRLEGVFFKSWLYRSRKLIDTHGETSRQQQRYTPVVLSAVVKWIQPVPDRPGWWGLAAGIGFLICLTIAWVKFIAHWRSDRRPPRPDDMIDLPKL